MSKKENKPAPPMSSTTARLATPKKDKPTQQDFAFGRENYILMIAGIVLIFLGFILMSGGGSKDPAAWNPDIFSFRRITLAPVLVILGLVVEVFAIVKKSKE